MAKRAISSTDLLDRLRSDILLETLRPGSRLTEQFICDKYGAHRPAVRETFHYLKSEGLVELVPNRGAFIIGFTKGDIADLFGLRAVCEAQAVRWAISRIYPAELESLEDIFDRIGYYTKREQYTNVRKLNADFHIKIAVASHNRMLIETLKSYRFVLDGSKHTHDYAASDMDEIYREHSNIFDAFIVRDAALGAEAMLTHIKNATLRAMS